MIITPMFMFGLLLASTYGLGAHLIVGGNVRFIIFAVLTATIGFSIGQAIAEIMAIQFLLVGQLNVVAGSVSSMIALITMIVLFQPMDRTYT